MNICILSGRIEKNATIQGSESKALAFIVETSNSSNGNGRKDVVACVLFNPTLELEGRVSSSKSPGEKHFNSDVIVRTRTFTIVKPHEPARN